MAKVWDTAQVRAAIERLAFGAEELGPAEIHRRLHAQQAGLPWAVTISKRQVAYYLRDIRERRIREAAENPNAAQDEVVQLERRMIDRLAQEVAYIEAKRLGRLTPEDLRKLNTAHRSLIDIEKRTRKFTKRKLGGGAATEPAKEETPLERMAREERDRQADSTPETAAPTQSVGADQQPPEPPQPTSDVERSDSEPVHDNGSEHASDLPTDQESSSQVDRQGGPTLPDPAVIQARRAAAASGVASGHPA